MEDRFLSQCSLEALENLPKSLNQKNGYKVPNSFLIEGAIIMKGVVRLAQSGIPFNEKAYTLFVAKRLQSFFGDLSADGCPFRERSAENPTVDICTYVPD